MQVQRSRSEQETLHIGENIGRTLHAPQVVLLYGDLGSGKTVLARGLSRGLGVEDTSVVRSPSFTLVNQYQGRESPVYHVDLYRLDTLGDLYSIGLEEILTTRSVVIVEWSEKLTMDPSNALRIHIRVDPETDVRRFEIENRSKN